MFSFEWWTVSRQFTEGSLPLLGLHGAGLPSLQLRWKEGREGNYFMLDHPICL